MKNVLAILQKELRTFFVSPIAYVVLTVFLIISGYFFYNIVSIFVERSMMAMMQSQQFGGPPPAMDVPSLVTRNFFGVISTVILFMLPMITMAAFADEKRRGTMELLLTSPITNVQIVLGKFLAALSFFIVMLLPTMLYYGFVFAYSSPEDDPGTRAVRLFRLAVAGWSTDLPWHLHFNTHRKPNRGSQHHFWRLPHTLGYRSFSSGRWHGCPGDCQLSVYPESLRRLLEGSD